MRYNERGHEMPDPTPVAIPVGFRHPPSMQEMIRMYVRRELSEAAGKHEAETFEEADDFNIPDDPIDPHSQYEELFDPAPAPPSKPLPVAPSAGANPVPTASVPPEASSPSPP